MNHHQKDDFQSHMHIETSHNTVMKNGQMVAHNPLTKSGKGVMGSMKKQYGTKKGKQVFYASINKGKAGSQKWHR